MSLQNKFVTQSDKHNSTCKKFKQKNLIESMGYYIVDIDNATYQLN